MAQTKCTNHCRTCERHFTSLVAFDRHRVGQIGFKECADPAELGMTAIKGVCDISDDKTRKGTVWTTRSLD